MDKKTVYASIIKRSLDVVFAFCLLIVCLPVFVVVTILLYLSQRGNPFFIQKRVGRKLRIFKVIKFRTMSDQYGADGALLPDQSRLSGIGKIVRKTSIDELPQLLNVIRGEMSLVGPRPLLVQYLPLYSSIQIRRHEVLPGITGWAQINGRNSISWQKKLAYDVWYVDNISFCLDLRIIFTTILKVFKAEGITLPGMATTEPFNGKN